MSTSLRPILFLVLLAPLVGCSSTSGGGGDASSSSRSSSRKKSKAQRARDKKAEKDLFSERKTEKVGKDKPVPKPTRRDLEDFQRVWGLYRQGDPRWPIERDRYKRRGDAASYILAGHLIRYYMQLNSVRERTAKKLTSVKAEIVAVGAPCAPFLVNLMVLDRVPLSKGQYFYTDDLTRQDCQDMLERMGSPALPELLKAARRKDLGPKGRRLTALTLGGTGDPRAYKPLVLLLQKDPSWQVRADAATALGRLGDPRAAKPLLNAVRTDPDQTVVKRAGKARYVIAKKLNG